MANSVITDTEWNVSVTNEEITVTAVAVQGPIGPAGPAGATGPAGADGADGAPGVGVPVGGTTGQVLKKNSNTDYDTVWAADGGTTAWGGIVGTLSDQTDLQTALNGKSDTTHNHDLDYADINHNHDLDYADIAHNHTGVYEPADATILKDADIGVTVAAQNHNHDLTYAPLSHTHVMADVTDSTWISDITAENLGDLADVQIVGSPAPVDGQALIFNGVSGKWENETLPSGVTDHGLLSGLGDDDHTQYHTDARGDARYYTQSQVDTKVTGAVNDALAFAIAFGA